MITLPKEVIILLEELNKAGHSAYVVGGCVRDSLLGLTPGDWDICTSALPDEMKDCFSRYHIIETGLQHGTLTIRINHQSYEITTFRTDGDYQDCRHPKQVTFVSNIKEDLARRDFTINAMAYHPEEGLIDFYDGQKDLQDNLLRCVGDGKLRFSEDALRIMRGLRFAATYGFSIENKTSDAIILKKHLLTQIAVERISVELKKLLMGDYVESVLMKYCDVFAVLIPELAPMFHFEQKNPHHLYDVWTHTVKSVCSSAKNIWVRLAVLFHDIGKPSTFSLDENGVGHFYSHSKASAELTEIILKRMKFDGVTVNCVTELVKYHDAQIDANEKSVKRWLNKIGTERFEQLLLVKDADASSTVYATEKRSKLSEIRATYTKVIQDNACFSLKDLAITGNDLISCGISPGKQIGILLNKLLYSVIDGEISNQKDELLFYAKNEYKKITEI